MPLNPGQLAKLAILRKLSGSIQKPMLPKPPLMVKPQVAQVPMVPKLPQVIGPQNNLAPPMNPLLNKLPRKPKKFNF